MYYANLWYHLTILCDSNTAELESFGTELVSIMFFEILSNLVSYALYYTYFQMPLQRHSSDTLHEVAILYSPAVSQKFQSALYSTQSLPG